MQKISIDNIDTASLSTVFVTNAAGPVLNKITTVYVTDSSYNNTSATAVDVTGGYIKIVGTGFVSGCQVLINTVPAAATTFISSTEVRAQVSAATAGTYIVYLVNSDGGTAIRVNGITFSVLPFWQTSSSLVASSSNSFSTQLSATDAVSYQLASGSSLPSNTTLTSGGLLSGNVTVANSTTYNFTITAIDAENQESQRAFSLLVNTSLGIRCRYMRITETSYSYNHTVWQMFVKGTTDSNQTYRFLFNDSDIRSAVSAPATSWGNGFGTIDDTTGYYQAYFRSAGLASGGYFYYISESTAYISHTIDFTTSFPTIGEIWISGDGTNNYDYWTGGYVQFSLDNVNWSSQYPLAGLNAYNDIPAVTI